jgi:hypothetical protein
MTSNSLQLLLVPLVVCGGEGFDRIQLLAYQRSISCVPSLPGSNGNGHTCKLWAPTWQSTAGWAPEMG